MLLRVPAPRRTVPPAMATSPTAPHAPLPRVLSVDALRGLTILVMIFVNDVAGVANTPGWMEHFHVVRPDGSLDWYANGMTFVDVVFPAFLFIVGVSIPFAIGRRLDRGEPARRVGMHVLTRTLGLLIAGVFMVNDAPDWQAMGWPQHLWKTLMYTGIILTWVDPPRERGPGRMIAILTRLIGAGLLAFLALSYRDRAGVAADAGWWRQHVQMHTSWWGILGLIGWAYLVACAAYTALRRNMAGMVGVVALLHCLCFADRAGVFASGGLLAWLGGLDQWLDIGSVLGSHGGITCAGVVLGMMLMPGSPVQTHTARVRWGLLFGLGLFTAGVLLYQLHGLHTMFTINKNAATPPWCLICSALTVWGWVVLYWLMDVRRQAWIGHGLLTPSGQAPLMAYVLHPLLTYLFAMAGPHLPLPDPVAAPADWYTWLGLDSGRSFWLSAGLYRSVAMALFVCWFAGWLARRGLRLRL